MTTAQPPRQRLRAYTRRAAALALIGTGMSLSVHASVHREAPAGGHFEPTLALPGDGWHWLSANPRPVLTTTPAVPAVSPVSAAPVASVAPEAAAPAPADSTLRPLADAAQALQANDAVEAPPESPAAVALSVSPGGAVPLSGSTAMFPVTTTGGTQTWRVSAQDTNYRLLIEKWAAQVGWTPGQWELDQDVPIEATAEFIGDFKAAVRHVLAATEMTDYSLKPCFYSNNLVRVVKLTTKCDPSK